MTRENIGDAIMKPKPPIPTAPAALRRHAEGRLRAQQRNLKSAVPGQGPAADAERTLHELQVHQIELEMQNTELQQARDRLEVQLEKYTDLYDFAPVAYFSFDEQGVILEVNLTGAALLGVERSRLINGRFSRFVAPAGQPDFRAFLKRVFAGSEQEVCELAMIKEDDAALWARLRGTVAVSAGDPRKWCRVSVADITAFQQADEARAQLAAIVESSDDAIIGKNLDGIITSWNRAAERLYGYTEAEAVGQPVMMLIPTDLRVEEPRILEIIRRGEAVSHYETTRRRKDGTAVEVSLTVSPLKNAHGEIVGASKIVRDITERKQLERERQITNQKLLSSSEELKTKNKELAAISEKIHLNNEQLEERVVQRTAQLQALAVELTQAEERERRRIAQVLHDGLQQLLVGATVHLEIMRQQKDPRSRLEALRRVEQLIQESNDVARGLSHELSPVALQHGNLGGALKWLAGWMTKNHRLTVRVEAEDVAAPVEDSVKVLLFQSVRELLFNVVKHAGVKRAKVRMTVTQEDQLEILVSDQGKGFDAARTTTGGETSAGLGLFSIRERLYLLGGRMEVESLSGRGSRFRLLAPLQKPPPSNAAPKLPLPAPRAKARPPAASVARPGQSLIRVVLADDHKVMRDGLTVLLAHQSKIEVVGVASDGQEAIQQTRKLQPDLVIMDINMPLLDGIRATREITAAWPGIKVIGLTMHTDALRHQAMLEAGAVNCLSKSSLSRDLIKTIHAAFAPAPTRSGKRFAKKTVRA